MINLPADRDAERAAHALTYIALNANPGDKVVITLVPAPGEWWPMRLYAWCLSKLLTVAIRAERRSNDRR